VRILVVRNDGLGDLILTLPSISWLRKESPGSQITVLVSSKTKDILWNNKDIDEVMIDHKENVLSLARRLKQKRFDVSYVLFPSLRNSLACFLAKIPSRVGTGYKASGIFFNKKMFIHRTKVIHHESEYCLKIVGCHNPSIETPCIHVKDEDREYARGLLSGENADFDFLVGVHPGSRSSLNLGPNNYAKLIDLLFEKHKIRAVITGSKDDRETIDEVFSNIKTNPINLYGKTDLSQLIGLFSFYKIFIGGATGPMHLASSLGIKTIALFPPIISQSKEKWHPLGDYIAITPDIDCKKKICTKRCKDYNCMDKIELDRILKIIH